MTHLTNAEKSRRYRDARRVTGLSAKRGKHGKGTKSGQHHSLFDAGHFVAVDGEGFNRGDPVTRTIGTDGREYIYHAHEYALLSASDGSEIYNPGGRLGTKTCLDFLLDIKRRDKRAILVCFGASYDMCHMLAFDLVREELQTLLHGDGTLAGRKCVDITLTHEGETHDYRIELRTRKSLSIWRWAAGEDKYERHTKQDGSKIWRMTKCDKVVLWDVWGFFQGTFVGALESWLPNDPDTALIADMKAKRSSFQRSEIATVREYNTKELRCLVDLMNLMRDAIRQCGLTVSRWDGAGAVASAFLRKYSVQEHMAASPPEVFAASCHAYSGGHIEAYKLGHHAEKVYHYDINSAYPHQFRYLPSLAAGDWRHGVSADGETVASGDNPPMGFTLVRVAYRFKPGFPFYPLFYRTMTHSIIYPERGHGWYWYPEFDAARAFAAKFGAIEFRVIEWWNFEPKSNAAPFGWIEQAYELRKAIIAESKRTGVPNGAHYSLRLGYNACYGKTAQQVGARWQNGKLHAPAYFQLEWSGYVTAGCRAQLMHAAMQAPHDIIAIATDGIFSTVPLDLPCRPEKVLGEWEAHVHDGMTIVMPGVYWLHDGAKQTHFSRGFDKATMSESDFVHQVWREGKDHIDIKSRRMVTLGTALMSDAFWEMRGCFAETVRELKLNGFNSKRYGVAMSSAKPHKGLVITHPQDLLEDYDMPLDNLMSEPYPISWQKQEDAEETPEHAEMTDADRSFFFDRQALILA
jgi:phage gp36-like protein